MGIKQDLKIRLTAGDTIVAEIVDDDLWAQLLKRARSGELRRRRLQRLANTNGLSISQVRAMERVVVAVAEAYDVTEEQIAGQVRVARVSRARHLAMYLLREDAKMTLEAIAGYFQRHHTTVMANVASIERRLEVSEQLRTLAQNVRDELASDRET